MNLVTWNCNGAFRNKTFLFDKSKHDIIVIQECEDPSKSTDEYKQWASNYLWIGNNKNKGLGVFCNDDILIEKLPWSDIDTNNNEKLESFLPCLINDEIILIAIWTKKGSSKTNSYIGQLWKYLQIHKSKLKDKKVIMLGDFNSNDICYKSRRSWNHRDLINELLELDIISTYHILKNEEQGKESLATFYLVKKLEKSYHLDYIFMSNNLFNSNFKLIVGETKKWITYSDHMPLFYNNNISNLK